MFISKLVNTDARVAQLDRVPGYEPGGQRFESSHAYHIYLLFIDARVAQLDRVPGYEPGGQRFESSHAYHKVKVPRRGGRVAEGAPLLREYGLYLPSRVRIPPSPPLLLPILMYLFSKSSF